MRTLLRVACVSNKISVANPSKTAKDIITDIKRFDKISPDIILFPQDALVGSQCKDLFKSPRFINQIYDNVILIAKELKDKPSIIVIGGTALKNGIPKKVAFVLRKGKIIATIDDCDYTNVFEINGITFNICADMPKNTAKIVSDFSSIGTDLILFPTAINATAQNISQQVKTFKYLSNILKSGIAISNSGISDTSYPNIKKGFTGIFECGNIQHFRQSFTQQCESTFDLDCDIIRSQKIQNELPIYSDIASYKMSNPENHSILRTFSKTPYLPAAKADLDTYLDNLFELQAASLANRMKNIGCTHLVIGVSGGLDSTLALLVCVKAMKMLYIPTQNITAVTMRGLGTSTKTYDNSVELIKQLNVNLKDIPIEKAVLQHFSDISHSTDNFDVTYENAQARERTQILFSLANMQNALVVGTGDLSEASLGFCTFGGDHLASFNVNVCINKTSIRFLVLRLAETEFDVISKVLKDILSTPISPELLPTDENGQITQKTEGILGEYILHDLFLYYLIKYNFSIEKILTYAVATFKEKYEKNYISKKLDLFISKLISSQFKRSCSVDCANITEVNLENFAIPSDLSNDIAKYL